MKDKRIVTYSMMQSFLGCRKHYDYRYLRELVPVEDYKPYVFGTLVHAGLENWFKYGIKAQALNMVDSLGAEMAADENEIAKCYVLVEKYIELYKDESFDVVDVEKVFQTPLVNPATHRKSYSWILSGKADGVVRMNGKMYILEHKTTAAIDDAYIGRIAIDSQIALYANALSALYGEPVVGAIYDIILKPKIERHKGETQEEFEARRAELIAKSKTGKTTAKIHPRETLHEYKQRLRDVVNDSFFRREIVEFSKSALNGHMSEVWNVSVDMKRAVLYRNTGNCSKYGKPCPYLPICRSLEDKSVIENLYKRVPIHSELNTGENNDRSAD